jgi:DNA polymerase III delta prime subunit
MEWIPSEEEYNPGIAKEQWIELVQDKNIFNENALITFACIQKAKVSTCADMSEEFGRNTDFYRSNLWRTGERIYKKINCPLSEREEGGNRFWSVCCLGRELKNGRFEFKIRPELQEAFDVTGVLEGIEVVGGKNISCIMANIAWNENNWKSPSDNKTNFRWTQVEGNIPNESWNFDFDNPRNTEKKIFGFIQFTHPPKNAEKDRFLIIFRSLNKIVGFYGNAEIKKEAVKKNEYEYSNIIGDKELVVLLDNKIDDSDNNFLFGKDRVGMIGFNYLNTNNAQKILDEAIKLNPNQIEILNDIKQWLTQGDTQMEDENSLVSKYTDLLRNTKNIILTGAPGTGKTFMAKQISKELGCKDDNIGFVQFHPSYDYTDFVEGLRPTDKDGNGNVGFERRDGVFKEFCARALGNLVETPLNNDESQNFDEAWEKLLDEVRENIAAGKLTKIGIWEYGLSSTNSLKYESIDTQSKYTFTITKKNVFDAYRGIKARPSGYFQKYMKEVADYMKKYGLKEYKEKSGVYDVTALVFGEENMRMNETYGESGKNFVVVQGNFKIKYAVDVTRIKWDYNFDKEEVIMKVPKDAVDVNSVELVGDIKEIERHKTWQVKAIDWLSAFNEDEVLKEGAIRQLMRNSKIEAHNYNKNEIQKKANKALKELVDTINMNNLKYSIEFVDNNKINIRK